jgi:hypothetical protein
MLSPSLLQVASRNGIVSAHSYCCGGSTHKVAPQDLREVNLKFVKVLDEDSYIVVKPIAPKKAYIITRRVIHER